MLGYLTSRWQAAGDAKKSGRSSRSAGVKHIVVIYEENHSFDNLYGKWEGVRGLSAR